jgi:hypothetical protein
MKKRSAFIFFFLLLLLCSCRKNGNFSCEKLISVGRIIGYDPCLHFRTFNKVKDAGFVIEIDKSGTKDTVVTYDIPEGLFTFQSSYIDGSYSTYLFRPEVQDLFKIRFNFRPSPDRTFVICFNQYISDFTRAVKEREIDILCISKQ